MDISVSFDDATRRLGDLQKNDIIDFESQFINKDTFMVLSVEKDEEIPVILLQLWQFRGGYNHAVKNVMENDLGVNTPVPYYEPIKSIGVVEEIVNHRPKESGFSKKEEMFFDLWPEQTSDVKDEIFEIPYEIILRFENDEIKKYILPVWTPIQRLPIDKVKVGSVLEVWQANGIENIMRVLQV